MAAAVSGVTRHLPHANVSQLFRFRISSARHIRYTTSRKSSSMSSILTTNAMAPVGPYSQAMRTSHAIYVSGQLPALPDGTLVTSSMSAKTEACIQALAAILNEAGSGLKKIVKVQVFLTDMRDFGEMNEVYEKMITHGPARSCVAVKELPKGVDVEIECIALP